MDYCMGDILDIFNRCNKFSLSVAQKIDEIPAKDKKYLLENHLNQQKEFLKTYYDRFIKEGYALPDFEDIFADIVEECNKFYQKIKGVDISALCGKKESPFICDHVGKTTKYCEPRIMFWHFYHNIQHVFMANESLKELKELKEFNIDKFLINYPALEKNFLSYEYTYQTHCTMGPLQLVLTFKLNDETKEWLMQFETDYDLENSPFEDLAIYNNDKLEFSSCTHERFNSLD